MSKVEGTSLRQRYLTVGLLRVTLTAAILLLPFWPVASARGQAIANAKIHGTITDASGAAIPQATVTATLTASGQTATAVTSATGSYILPNLPVGAYVIDVKATGFQAYHRTGLILQVSNDVEVNAPLTIGSTDTVVNVVASNTQVQTEDNSITTVVDQARVVDLPLNGRNAANLVLLSGGAVPTATGHTISPTTYGSIGINAIGGAVAISIAGGQSNQINFLLDGGDNNHAAYNTNLPFPFPDALQEFSVQTTGLGAQYGLHPSGTVNIVTKSGANEFHGGAFEFLRNNYTSAANRISRVVTPLKRNQYGAYLGGPVLHDKLFFFGGYQGTALRISQTQTAVIPTTADLAGNWTPYFQAQRATTGVCPITTALAARLISVGFNAATTSAANCTATISPSAYSPTALNVSALLPTASTSDAIGNYSLNAPYPQNENQFIGRLDYTISPRQNVFARYFMTNFGAAAAYNGNLLTEVAPNLINRDKTLTLGHNFLLTQNLTNALHLTANRLAVQRSAANGIPTIGSLGSNLAQPEPGAMYLNVAGDFLVACATCNDQDGVSNQLQATDDISYVKGKHFLQAGFDYIAQKFNGQYINTEDGAFTVTGAYSGNALIDFLLGAPATLAQASGGAATLTHFRQNYFGYYLQDTYHLNKRLVLNAGLRYEPWLPPYNKDARGQTFSQANFNAGIVSQVFPNAPAGLLFVGDQGVHGTSVITPKYGDFSPRFGFALDVMGDGKQSLRGSYTLLFDEPSVLQTVSAFDSGVPYGGSVTNTLTNNSTTCAHNLDNPYQCVVGGSPFPSVFPAPASVAFPKAGIAVTVDPPNLVKPYTNAYNLSYQIQASSKWLLSVSYLGTHTVHLLGSFPINYATYYPGTTLGAVGSCGTLSPVPQPSAAAPTTPVPCSSTANTTQRLKLYQQSGGVAGSAGTRYGIFSQISNYGMANYNGVIVTANHQFSKNYTILANYTYSKCLANQNFAGDATPGPQNPSNLAAEYGRCNFDAPHNLSISGVFVSPSLPNHLVNLIAGGFQVSPLFSHRSGTPFTIGPGTDVSLTGLNNDRVNVVPGVPVYTPNFFTGAANNFPRWFNPAAFAAAAPGTFGNLQPFSIRGPSYTNLDLAISKFFTVRERAKLEIRGESFNILNHPNYNNPVGAAALPVGTATLNSPTVGLITSTVNDARILQIAAKITF